MLCVNALPYQAGVLNDQGKHTEAEVMYRDVLNRTRSVLGQYRYNIVNQNGANI